MSVNKVILVGRLGADPQTKYTQSGTQVTTFSLATSEYYTGRDGQKQENTEWHKIVVFGRLGENCAKYIHKGSQIYLEGRLQTSSWDDKDGNKRYKTEVIAQNVQFLDSPGGGNKSRNDNYDNNYDNDRGGGGDYNDRGNNGGNSRQGGRSNSYSNDYNQDSGGNSGNSAAFPSSFDDDDVPF